MCVCMCGKLVRKEGMGRHREETQLFCRLSDFFFYYTALRASGRMCILEIASTRDDYSFATISACTNLYMTTVMYIHHFMFLSSLKMKVNIDEHHSDLNNH